MGVLIAIQRRRLQNHMRLCRIPSCRPHGQQENRVPSDSISRRLSMHSAMSLIQLILHIHILFTVPGISTPASYLG